MANTIFISPGVYTSEQDFSVFASRIGITRLGLVGKTSRGKAFTPISISTADEYAAKCGVTSPDYPLSYVANAFLSQANEMSVVRVLGKTGFNNSPAWIITAQGQGTDNNLTLAVLRSKKNPLEKSFYYSASTDVILSEVVEDSTLGFFTISGVTSNLSTNTNTYKVSLDETQDNYIVNVLGKNPSISIGSPNLYVEKIYPHYLREATKRGTITGINSSFVFKDNSDYIDYTDSYQHAVTPWIVSRVKNGLTKRLFKVHTISDGDSANSDIKISIANIDTANNVFDLFVRDFNDTDSATSVLESFYNLSFDETLQNYIGKQIGTYDEVYMRKSNYITIELADNIPANTVPAGFEGYSLRSDTDSAEAPNIFYKTGYLSGDSVYKTYLGISELGYTGYTKPNVSIAASIKTLESDLFVYEGRIPTGKTTIKGFHLENTAPQSQFVSGDIASLTAYTNASGTQTDKAKLKFTVVPYGGFDGWDKYNNYATPQEQFSDEYVDNVDAFKEAIDAMSNPLETDINIFATPGIDFYKNISLIRYAIDMVETRADSLYIIDAPRVMDTGVSKKDAPAQVVGLMQSTGIDSNYAATYWPWIQINDSISGKYVMQSPTMMAVRAIAYTDSIAYPWDAPAGFTRGTAGSNVIKTDIKIDKAGMDTLYKDRINPIVSYVQQGLVIWGQKTLQIKQSALDRIAIRRLLLQARRLIAASSLTLVFEQNDQTLRDQFLAKVEPILLQIKNQRGLYDFKVVMDDSNNTPDTIDRLQLNGKIQLKPTRQAEYINLPFQVLPTGANFTDF